MPQRLKDMELDEVSLVDKPANRKARIVLMKRDDEDEELEEEEEVESEKGCPGGKKKKPLHKEGDDDFEKAVAGIQFVIGFLEEGGSEVQSVIFDNSKWDAARAKKWLEDHDMKSSKVDETENTLRFRQKDPDDFVRFRVITPGKQVSKALKASNSWQRLQENVSNALREKFQPKEEAMMPGKYLYVRDFYRDSVIFEQDGQTYRADYEIRRNTDGALDVTVGEAVPVEVVYQDITKLRGQTEDEDPVVVVPPELLIRVGKMQANIALLSTRVGHLERK